MASLSEVLLFAVVLLSAAVSVKGASKLVNTYPHILLYLEVQSERFCGVGSSGRNITNSTVLFSPFPATPQLTHLELQW